MWHNELPVGSSSQFAQWCVFGLAREHGITVLLDGQGADEAMGGYEQYFAYYIASLKARGETARLAEELPRIEARYPAATARGRARLTARLPYSLRHLLAHATNSGSDVRFGLQRGFVAHVSGEMVRKNFGSGVPLRDVLYEDSFERFLTTLLRYGDRNSMAHSREVRLPFCDSQYGETPSREELQRALREALTGLAPEAVLYPMGLFHADHVLVHEATRAALSTLRGAQSWLYEDALYRGLRGLMQQRLTDFARDGLVATPLRLGGDDAYAALKRSAVHAYRSQLQGFGPTAYADAEQAERYWRLEPAGGGDVMAP